MTKLHPKCPLKVFFEEEFGFRKGTFHVGINWGSQMLNLHKLFILSWDSCREGQAWLHLLTVLSSLLSAGCGRSPVWASVAGKHPGCRKHCWMPAKREDTDTPRDITADINAERSQNTACEFKIRRKAAVLAGCCKSETQTSKKTPVISGLRTSPFSLAC